jgi:hypothetical protein
MYEASHTKLCLVIEMQPGLYEVLYFYSGQPLGFVIISCTGSCSRITSVSIAIMLHFQAAFTWIFNM